MKASFIYLFILLCFLIGCANGNKFDYEDMDLIIGKNIYYHDRNCDGKVDEEHHAYINMYDTDYILVDIDFDGFYDIRRGSGFTPTKNISTAVPEDVYIQKQDKCVE